MLIYLLLGLAVLVLSDADAGSQDAVSAQVISASQPDSEQRVKLQFGGDIMLARDVSDTILQRGPSYIWGDILPILGNADFRLANLEGVIGTSGSPFQPSRNYYFQADPIASDALSIAGFDFLSLANNHSMDFSREALVETMDRLDEADIAHAGAGRNLAEAARPVFLSKHAIDIAVLSFANHFRDYAAGPDTAGINVVDILPTSEGLKPVAESIEKARRAGADIVVISMHWGPNWRRVPTQTYVDYARAVIDAGADIFHGHSAHIFQGIESYKGKLILYDLGDLINDYAIRRKIRNDYQITVGVTVSAEGIHSVEITPLVFEGLQVTRAKGQDFAQISEMVQDLSSWFETAIYQEGDSLFVKLE